MHLPTAQKSRSERNCSGFFLCRGIIKRCTPLGSKCTPHRPFVKWYRGVKRNRLRGDHFRTTVEPVIVKRYRKTLVNRGFYKKKLDTRFDTHCIKTGVQLWSECGDLNPGPLGPEPSALPTALHPVSPSIIRFFGPNVKMHFAVRVHILQCGYTVFRCGYALFGKNPKKIRPSP